MTSRISQHCCQVLEEALALSNQTEISFENSARYNNSLKATFYRTVQDVDAIGSAAQDILEVGAFTGCVSVALAKLGHRVVASDIEFVIENPELKKLLSSQGISTFAADLSNATLPVADNRFDLLVFNEVLEHLNFNPIPLLGEFWRILRPGGRVYCATPNLLSAKNRWRMLRGLGYINPVSDLIMNLQSGTGMSVGLHWREYSKLEMTELFEAAGFVCESHKFGLITPNSSGFPRKQLVAGMYRCFPQLMPNQVGIFQKRVS
jgi:SAM-dependent methyltransferase